MLTMRFAAAILNNILRRHFAELTTAFLAPLDAYVDTLLADPALGLATEPDLPVKPFDVDAFCSFLAANPPDLPVQTSRSIVGLYQVFVKTPNFEKWLRDKYRAGME